MKKYYLVVLLLLTIPSSLFALDFTISFDKETCCPDSSIVIDPLPGVSPVNGPRSSVIIPITASYESVLSCVILSFSYNLGQIVVEIMNTTAGGDTSYIIDTQFLSAIIPVNFGIGHYILTFTLPSGQQYRGEFDV